MKNHRPRNARRRKMKSEDRISKLPDEILLQILSYLPTRQAIRTGILSNRWRALWTQSPTLDFFLELNIHQDQYIQIINTHLETHKSRSVHRIQIHLLKDQPFSPAVETWFRFATTRGVREFILKTYLGKAFLKIPDFFFRHEPLTKLSITFGSVVPPLDFKGFSNLKILQLCVVEVSDETVEKLLQTCPVLERLFLMQCDGIRKIKVCGGAKLRLRNLQVVACRRLQGIDVVEAPNLVGVTYEGPAIDLRLKGCGRLVEAAITFWATSIVEDVRVWRGLAPSVTGLKYMRVCSCFSQFIFADYYINRSPHHVFMNLKEFHWFGDLGCEYLILALAAFLGDCPSLHKLTIDAENQCLINPEDWSNWYNSFIDTWMPPPLRSSGFSVIGRRNRTKAARHKKHYLHQFNYSLNHLKTIDIVGFSGKKMEMDLVRFLLAKSLVLDSLLLTFPQHGGMSSSTSKWVLQRQLSRLPKASNHAQVTLLEPPPTPNELKFHA